MTTNPSTPSESVLQAFANMSATLTGFQPSFIRPFLDPVNLSGTFYTFAVSHVQDGQQMMDSLLSAFDALSNQTPKLTPQQIADTLLEVSSTTPSSQAQLCQTIVLMWYLGSWYPPPFQTGGLQQVISSQAYTKSLVWNLAQAHPMGFSAFTFGYWSQAPASLDTFGVNTSNGGGQ
ncbi:MAG TPA: hypothetical protein VGQ41_01540 [Pyrinomonadaceae bacterium]|jgi:hypothetical protein|nr:hypothetical protein [Pyrinomonadaceae bacterium]